MNEAAGAFRKALLLVPAMGTPSQAEVKTALAFTYYALGESHEALDIRNQTYGRINPFSLALLHALLGEQDKAFIAFSQVQEWGSFSVEQIRYFFPEALAPLRNDKRFRELVAEINQSWGLLADGSLP